MKIVYRIKANQEIIRQYMCTVLIYFDWLMELKPTMHMMWMADRVGQKICEWLTELQMAVNAWVAFAIKNCQLNYIVNYTNEIF